VLHRYKKSPKASEYYVTDPTLHTTHTPGYQTVFARRGVAACEGAAPEISQHPYVETSDQTCLCCCTTRMVSARTVNQLSGRCYKEAPHTLLSSRDRGGTWPEGGSHVQHTGKCTATGLQICGAAVTSLLVLFTNSHSFEPIQTLSMSFTCVVSILRLGGAFPPLPYVP
jgi:hypothetical protein